MTRSRARTALVAALVGALVTACGGGGGNGGGGNGTPSNNVEFAQTCEPPDACGGDPTGTWDVVDGCVQTPAAGFECAEGERTARGTVAGSYTFVGSGFDYSVDTELRQCGWIDSGGDGGGGSWTVEGTMLVLGGGTRTFSFCVEGDTLWLHEAAAEYPDLRVLKLKRGTSDAGAAP